MLVDALRQVGLVLNAGKTKILTTQSQHPAELVSPGGIVVEILERDRAHRWLGCKISTYTDGSHGLDLEHHLQAASRAFYANNIDWSSPWHHIPHEWNARALECAEQAGVKLWSWRCLEQHWKLASYIAYLSDNRWLKRALAWTAGRRRRIGRPTNTWDAQIQIY